MGLLPGGICCEKGRVIKITHTHTHEDLGAGAVGLPHTQPVGQEAGRCAGVRPLVCGWEGGRVGGKNAGGTRPAPRPGTDDYAMSAPRRPTRTT